MKWHLVCLQLTCELSKRFWPGNAIAWAGLGGNCQFATFSSATSVILDWPANGSLDNGWRLWRHDEPTLVLRLRRWRDTTWMTKTGRRIDGNEAVAGHVDETWRRSTKLRGCAGGRSAKWPRRRRSVGLAACSAPHASVIRRCSTSRRASNVQAFSASKRFGAWNTQLSAKIHRRTSKTFAGVRPAKYRQRRLGVGEAAGTWPPNTRRSSLYNMRWMITPPTERNTDELQPSWHYRHVLLPVPLLGCTNLVPIASWCSV